MDGPPGDASKSLQDLDGQDWGEPTSSSHAVRECHRLRRVPLREVSPEDLRLLLRQAVGVEPLLPIALDRLDADPFVAGDYHPGGLLKEVLAVPAATWGRHRGWRRRAVVVAARARARLNVTVPGASDRVVAMLRERLRRFIDASAGEPPAEE